MAELNALNLDLVFKRVQMELDDGNFDVAKSYLEGLLQEEGVAEHEIWWRLLHCACRVRSDEELIRCLEDIREYPEYTKAVRLARGKQKTAYKQMGENNLQNRIEQYEEMLELQMEREDYAAAYGSAKKLVEIFPTDPARHWRALLCRVGAKDDKALTECMADISSYEEYVEALDFASEEQAEKYRRIERKQHRQYLKKVLQAGKDALLAENFAKADEMLTVWTKEQPSDAEGWWLLLMARLNAAEESALLNYAGDLEQREEYQKAVYLAGDEQKTHYKRVATAQIRTYAKGFEQDAEAALQRGQWQLAEDRINRIFNTVSPHIGSSWWILLKVKNKSRNDEELVAKANDFTSMIEYNRALRYSDEEQVAYYTQIANRTKNYRLEYLDSFSLNAIENGSFVKAKQALTELLGVCPESPEYWWRLLLCRCRVRSESDLAHYDGDFSEMDEYKNAVAFANKRIEQVLDGEIAVTQDEIASLRRYEGFTDRQSEQKMLILAQADEAARAGLYEQATELYTRLVKGDSDNSELWWKLLLCKFGVQNEEELVYGLSEFSTTREFKNALKNADFDQAKRYNSLVERQRSEESRLESESAHQLESGDFAAAQEGYLRLLTRFPKRGDCWWQLLKAKCGVRQDEELVACEDEFSIKEEFMNAIRYSNVQTSNYYRSFVDRQKQMRLRRVEEIARNLKEYQKLVEYKMFTKKNKVKNGVLLLYKGDATVLDYPLENLFIKRRSVEEAPVPHGGAGTLVLPLGITGIQGKNKAKKGWQNAFRRPDAIRSVYTSDSVTEIGAGSFASCRNLKEVRLSLSVTKIGESAFEDCAALERVEMPFTVTEIEAYAFKNCAKIVEVALPTGLLRIGKGAFEGCSSLRRLMIPERVTSIQEGVFNGCFALEELALPTKSLINFPHDVKKGLKKVRIVSGNTLWDGAFKDCSELEEVSLSDSVHLISGGVFENCTSVASMVINASVSNVGARAFAGWTEKQTIYVRGGRSQVASWNKEWLLDCNAKIVYQ